MVQLIKGLAMFFCPHHPEGVREPDICDQCEAEREDKPTFYVTTIENGTITINMSADE